MSNTFDLSKPVGRKLRQFSPSTSEISDLEIGLCDYKNDEDLHLLGEFYSVLAEQKPFNSGLSESEYQQQLDELSTENTRLQQKLKMYRDTISEVVDGQEPLTERPKKRKAGPELAPVMIPRTRSSRIHRPQGAE